MIQLVEPWRCLVDERPTAAEQMAFDEALAQQDTPTFRLFRWARPAVSIGVRQQPPSWADREALSRQGIEWVRRPTGGGLAVHGSDLSCSVVVPHDTTPRLRELLGSVCDALAEGLRGCGASVAWRDAVEPPRRIAYCLTEESPYALMVGDRKLGGVAIRRYAEHWLIQGSWLLRPIPMVFKMVMPRTVAWAFCAYAISLEEAVGRMVPDDEAMERLMDAWRYQWPCEWRSGQAHYSVTLPPSHPATGWPDAV